MFASWLRSFSETISANAGQLTELDSAIGDADHGSNMDRGMKAVVAALDGAEFDTADALFKKVGMTLVSTVGGASGPLYGTFFLRFGSALKDVEEMSAPTIAAALRAGVEGIVSRGKAEPGDKTMVDALVPALEALQGAGDDAALGEALRASADAAGEGMKATVPMEAKRGRASYLGPRSVGHQDPGATSTHMLLDLAATTFGGDG
jgi:dihydroxyacetone kinase-like protein